MNVDTGQFRALTAELEVLRDQREAFGALAAEVAAMRTEMTSFTEAVAVLRTLDLPVAAIYDTGRSDEREAILGGHRPRRPRRERPAHLSAVTR